MQVIALSSRPKPPRLTYAVQKVRTGFLIVDADGEAWSDVFASEPAALQELAGVRRRRAAYEYAEDRLARIQHALVEQRFVKTPSEARQIVLDALA